MRTIIMLLLFGCQLGFGQVTNECKPSTLNVPSAQYPCVYPDHRSTFRVVTPDAQKAQVRVEQNFDMVKGIDRQGTLVYLSAPASHPYKEAGEKLHPDSLSRRLTL
jgi:hypothetical protein